MSTEEKRADPGSDVDIVSARDSAGRFARLDELEAPSTAGRREQRHRATKERDYLRSIVKVIGEEDLASVAARIVKDARGDGDVDVKVINAAREWIGKYLLGNARVALDDCDDLPAIVKRR
jgi:hypothetical protein